MTLTGIAAGLRQWTPQEDERLRALWPDREAAADLLDRSVNAVERRAAKLGIVTPASPPLSLEDRFEASTYDDGDHLVWVGTTWKDGTPRLGSDHNARRWSFERKYGATPPGQFVRVGCGNPACVRPDHLYLVGSRTAGMVPGTSKLNESLVVELRRRWMAGEFQTFEAAGDAYGISGNQASLIIHGKAWRHVWPFNQTQEPMSTNNGVHNRLADHHLMGTTMNTPPDFITVLTQFGPDQLGTLDDEITRLRSEAAELTLKADKLAAWKAAFEGVFAGRNVDPGPHFPEPAAGKAPAGTEPATAPATEHQPKQANKTQQRIAYQLAVSGPLRFGQLAELLAVSQSAISENIKHPWFTKGGAERSPYHLTPAGVEAMRAKSPGLEIKPQEAD
jgi:hypothetical protein